MDSKLRVIIIEDSEIDAVFLLRQLKEGGYESVHERVETAEEMIAALDRQEWDIVIADYSLPRFNIHDALAILKEKRLDLPFIIVSGIIREETAVAAMKAGAHDYLMKDKLARLVPAVKRELHEAEERKKARRFEEELFKSEKRFRELVELLPEIVLEMDTKGRLSFVNHQGFVSFGFSKEEFDGGLSAYQLIVPEDHAKAENYIRQRIGEQNAEYCELKGQRKDGSTFPLILHITPVKQEQETVALRGIAVDITERKRWEVELQQSFDKLKRTLDATVKALATAVESRDPYIAGHQQRVADLSCAMAQEMGLPADEIDGLRVAALLHDIGKIYVPAGILSRPGELMDVEMNLIKVHPEVGYEILKGVEFPWPVALTIRQHHEKLDGSGYPDGLDRHRLLLQARILAVADVVEAMASHRPYRPSLGLERALQEILTYRDILYDAGAVDACVRLFRQKGYTLEKT
jgi:PAS domain S-box-containing protein/putative nucleotidyltransferase with HDIG domain